ncbi:MAG TPA: hypothetical protein VME68_16745 [Acidobacteriaceae bacterium]|nr:hypothetical protein [Acidobacteriaceae bacterium]
MIATCEDTCVDSGSVRKFHDELMNGLHAVAQPLTILRAAMEMLSRSGAPGIDRKHYLEISTEQVVRACDLFSAVQDLVASNVTKAQHASFDLGEVLEPVIEAHAARMQARGVGLAVVRPEPWQKVTGDADRTEQAFRAMLNTALSLASHGDVIEIYTSRAAEFAEITVKHPQRHGKGLNSSDRLSLSLAEVNIVSQLGKYRCAPDPFCCWFALPIEKPVQPERGPFQVN